MAPLGKLLLFIIIVIAPGYGDWVPPSVCGSSGTDGGTLVLARRSPRRIRGGLELLSELDRATLDVFGRISLPGSLAPATVPATPPGAPPTTGAPLIPWPCGRTIVFRSSISVGVISDGSTNGSGRFEDFRI
uniref:Putative secreted peptide n=1 Tax=Anopheles braziliensis TaxID=58242 RepID=A0A2M3ZQ90_9DIPT